MVQGRANRSLGTKMSKEELTPSGLSRFQLLSSAEARVMNLNNAKEQMYKRTALRKRVVSSYLHARTRQATGRVQAFQGLS